MRFTSQQNFGVFFSCVLFSCHDYRRRGRQGRGSICFLVVLDWVCGWLCVCVLGQLFVSAHQPGRHLSQMHQTRMKITGHGPLCTGRPTAQGGHFDFLDFRFLQTFCLRTSILKPNFHLCLSQTQRWGELCTLRNAQVLLLPKLLLQREQLLCGERGAWLPIGFVFPQIALDAWRLVGICKRKRECWLVWC